MKVTVDGVSVHFPVLRCTGYRADSITLYPNDARILREAFRQNDCALIEQLLSRLDREGADYSPIPPTAAY